MPHQGQRGISGGLPPSVAAGTPVAPGPRPGVAPPQGPPQQAPAGPQLQPGAGQQGQGQAIPAPNSQGALGPQQAQIVAAVLQDPLILETLVNIVTQQQQQQQQQAQPQQRNFDPAAQQLFGG